MQIGSRRSNRLWLALTLRPRFFLGVRIGPWWVKLKSAREPLLFSERYGYTWNRSLAGLRLAVVRR